MDPRKLNDVLPGTNLDFSQAHESLTEEEMAYLYGLDEDEDFGPSAFARSKDMAVDALMTGFVQAYKYEDQVMAADIVMPIKPVRSRIGSYKKRGKEALDVSVTDQGSDKGETNEILMKVGEGTYSIDIYKLKIFVSDDEIKEQGAVQPIQEAVVLLKHGIDLRQEIRVRNLAEATGAPQTAAAAAVWDTGNTVNTDITAAKNAFALLNGMEATHIQFNKDVANEMLANAAQDAGVFGTVPSPLDGKKAIEAIDANKFPGLPWGLKPVITNVMYSTAVGPADAQVAAYVWPDNAYLFRVDMSARSTTWGIQPELMPSTIIRWRDEDRGGWFIKIIRKRTKVIATAQAIYEITTVT